MNVPVQKSDYRAGIPGTAEIRPGNPLQEIDEP
jgi:hypothetical protein